MKNTFEGHLNHILLFIEEKKIQLFQLIKKNLKFILPILLLGLVFIPDIVFGLSVLFIASIVALLVIKKALYYLLAIGVFFAKGIIAIFAIVLVMSFFLWISGTF